MGKIIKNNIVYGGTYDNATSVNYDNTLSGLNARTVQEGIDELTKGSVGAFPVDNLLSTSTDIPLSANQGRVLDEKINSGLGGVRFGVNGDGSYGYYKADDSFVPFSSGKNFYRRGSTTYNASAYTKQVYTASLNGTKKLYYKISASSTANKLSIRLLVDGVLTVDSPETTKTGYVDVTNKNTLSIEVYSKGNIGAPRGTYSFELGYDVTVNTV